jgi:hypothetical protein
MNSKKRRFTSHTAPRHYLECRHPLDRRSRYSLRFSLWRRPPTGHATLCNDPAPVSHGGALCPNRTIGESMRWNAYVWRPIACNWRAWFMTPLCKGISFGWRGNGPTRRFRDLRRALELEPNQMASPSPRADLATSPRQCSAAPGAFTSCVALSYRPEPQSRAASRRHRTAP